MYIAKVSIKAHAMQLVKRQILGDFFYYWIKIDNRLVRWQVKEYACVVEVTAPIYSRYLPVARAFYIRCIVDPYIKGKFTFSYQEQEITHRVLK